MWIPTTVKPVFIKPPFLWWRAVWLDIITHMISHFHFHDKFMFNNWNYHICVVTMWSFFTGLPSHCSGLLRQVWLYLHVVIHNFDCICIHWYTLVWLYLHVNDTQVWFYMHLLVHRFECICIVIQRFDFICIHWHTRLTVSACSDIQVWLYLQWYTGLTVSAYINTY